jgi:hypothetical protein
MLWFLFHIFNFPRYDIFISETQILIYKYVKIGYVLIITDKSENIKKD